MKKRQILYFSGAALILFVLLVLSKLLYPPPPVAKSLSNLLPDSPLLYLHASNLQARLKDFSQHKQYQRLLQTPRLQSMLGTDEGQAQLATFQSFWEDKLLSPMQFIGKELAFALYRSSSEARVQPSAILLSRVSDKAKLAERVFYAFDWLTEVEVEKLPLKLYSHQVYQVQQQDLLFPIYYSLISDVAVIGSSIELLETVITRLSEDAPTQEKQGGEAELFETLVRRAQPDSRFMTAFADLPALAAEISSNRFFSDFYFMNLEGVEQMKDAPPLFSVFDIYPESIRLKIEFSPSTESQAAPQIIKPPAAANSCWENSEAIRQFPLLLDISPDTLSALLQRVQEIFPQAQQDRQNLLQEYQLWDSAIECRISAKPVGRLYALPDLVCASDSVLSPEESITAINGLLNTILEQQVPQMLRSTMLRQERKAYRDTPMSTLQVMFQDVFSYAALNNQAGMSFNILATNSAAVKQGIDTIRTEADAIPSYCMNVPAESKSKTDAGENGIVPAAGLWIHADRLARFLEDFSQTKSFELLVPRSKNPELYAQLPELLLSLRSLPPMYLEIGLQEDIPTAKLWSQGYDRKQP